MSDLQRVGILGVGSMGTALLEGLTDSSATEFEITIYDEASSLLNERAEAYEVESADSVEGLFNNVDFVVLCVKPSDVEGALEPVEGETHNLVGIAAGVPISRYGDCLASNSPIIRVMPNTPAQVGEGMSFLCGSDHAGEAFMDAARTVFRSVGRVKVVDESSLDAVTALSGSGPAYVFYFIEAIREAGVYTGLRSEDSYEAALQTVLGSAKLALEDDRSPAELREAVSSPGGTTVEALRVLDERGVKGKIKEAVIAAFEKSQRLK